MKKRVFGALVAAMVLTFGMTVNAASPTTTTTSTDVPAAVSVAKESSASQTAGVVLNTNTISDAAAVAAVNNTLTSATSSATIKAVFDLTNNGSAVKNASGTYTVTVSLPSAAAGKSYVVLHYTGAAWEVLAATAGAGTITFDTASFSPFVIVETASAAVAGEPSWAAIVRAYGAPWPYGDSATATGTVASPKTGEMMSVAMMVMVIAAAGAVFAAKKYAR